MKDLLGEKTAADDEKLVKKKKEKKPRVEVRILSFPLLVSFLAVVVAKLIQ
jgi:hypothetical protein